MVHIRCDVRKRTEKASDDLPGGSKAVEVEQGVVHAIYAVAAEAAVLIGENPVPGMLPEAVSLLPYRRWPDRTSSPDQPPVPASWNG